MKKVMILHVCGINIIISNAETPIISINYEVNKSISILSDEADLH